MEQPLVSIAICTYNGSKHLAEQLDGLLHQDYPNIELVICDDGSKDATIEIVNNYAERFKNIRSYQNEQNLGYIKNFEKAIGLCRGDYIALSDQDDIWALDKISLMVDQIGDAALIYHDSAFVYADGAPMGKNISDILNMYEGNQLDAFYLYNCASGHAMLFKKELVEKVIPFDKKFPHDWLIALIATENGGIKYIDKPLVKYRQHETSETDILRIKGTVKTKNFNELNLQWLQFVQTKIKRKTYLNTLINCFKEDNSVKPLRRFELLVLLLKHWEMLFFIKKKSRASKLNYVRKICFSKTMRHRPDHL